MSTFSVGPRVALRSQPHHRFNAALPRHRPLRVAASHDAEPVKMCVYGSLMPWMPNAYRLEKATCLGACQTAPAYRLYDSGNVPAVCKDGDTAIRAFLYAVGPEELREIDAMEGHPGGRYTREEITLAQPAGERAWMYIAEKKRVDWGSSLVRSGDWLLHKRGLSVVDAAARLAAR